MSGTKSNISDDFRPDSKNSGKRSVKIPSKTVMDESVRSKPASKARANFDINNLSVQNSDQKNQKKINVPRPSASTYNNLGVPDK